MREKWKDAVKCAACVILSSAHKYRKIPSKKGWKYLDRLKWCFFPMRRALSPAVNCAKFSPKKFL